MRERASGQAADAVREASWTLDAAQLCDVELLVTGALAPVQAFMSRAEVEAVRTRGTLPDGTPWPVAIVLHVSRALAEACQAGREVTLRGAEGEPVARLAVEECWEDAGARWAIGGALEAGSPIDHVDFADLRVPARDVAAAAAERGWRHVMAFHPDPAFSPAALARAGDLAASHGAGLLVQAFEPGDAAVSVERFARVQALRLLVRGLPPDRAMLSLMPYASRPGVAPAHDEFVRLCVARNCGATHVALDAGALGRRGLDAAAATSLARSLGLRAIDMPGSSEHATVDPAGHGRDRDEDGWPASADALLRHAFPPPPRQGVAVFFTGLSGAGKSTIARRLRVRLLEATGRPVTLLDGDLVRRHLSSELGFSREHRDLNVLRIGYVASEIVKHRGLVICAPIAPYAATRRQVRELIAAVGNFVLVHVDAAVATCEGRDRKGLYARARAGAIPQFTGVSDPYEPPDDADVVVRSEETTPEGAADQVMRHLASRGLVPGAPL